MRKSRRERFFKVMALFEGFPVTTGSGSLERNLACGVVVFAIALQICPSPTLADSICGPGKRLIENRWACGPDTGRRGSSNSPSDGGNRTSTGIAAGLAAGGALMGLVESLASGTRTTDDAGPAPSTHQNKPLTRDEIVARQKVWHGTQSRQLNRQGISLQLSGDYEGARQAFLKAAREAELAGNEDDAEANSNNKEIAEALLWLHKGYLAEQAGQHTRANISYKLGMDAAVRAKREDITQRLRNANDKLIQNNGREDLFKNDDDCAPINGEYSCRIP